MSVPSSVLSEGGALTAVRGPSRGPSLNSYPLKCHTAALWKHPFGKSDPQSVIYDLRAKAQNDSVRSLTDEHTVI